MFFELDDIDLDNINLNPDFLTRQSLYREYQKKGLDGVKADIQELADSIRSVGLLQPISVTPTAYKQYDLVIGLRRFLAAKLLKWKTIAAQVII